MVEAAEASGELQAGRHDRRADLGQHRGRAGDGRAGQGLQVRVRLPRQGQRGQAQRAGGVRRRGRGLPDRRGAGAPGLLLQRLGPAGLRETGAPGSPTSTPTSTTPAPTTRPPGRRSGSRPTAGSPTSSAGVGTGGTITGVGRYLKEQNPAVQVVGADPAGSVYSGGSGRPYLVEGVGEDFWPDTYDRDIADRIIEVSDADSFAFTRRLAREEALLVGGSSGMAAFAAVQLAEELAGTPEGDDAVIVVLLPDSGRGYLTKVFNDEWLGQYGFACGHETEADGRRGAARQVRPAARPRAHPSQRDDRRGGARSCRSTASRRCPWCAPSRRSWPPRWPARSRSAALLDALFAGRARLTDRVEKHMSPPLPTIGSTEAGRRRGRAARDGRRRAGAGGRQAGRRGHPPGPAGVSGAAVAPAPPHVTRC